MAKNRAAALAAAVLSAGLLVGGCGGGETATPAGGTGGSGGSDSGQPMKEQPSMKELPSMKEQPSMKERSRAQEGHMRGGEGNSMMRGDDDMMGKHHQRMQRGKHDSM